MDGDSSNPLVDDIEISLNVGKKTKSQKALMNAMKHILMWTGWTDCNAELLPDDIDLQPSMATNVQSAAQWQAAVISKHAQVLEQKAQHLHSAK